MQNANASALAANFTTVRGAIEATGSDWVEVLKIDIEGAQSEPIPQQFTASGDCHSCGVGFGECVLVRTEYLLLSAGSEWPVFKELLDSNDTIPITQVTRHIHSVCRLIFCISMVHWQHAISVNMHNVSSILCHVVSRQQWSCVTCRYWWSCICRS